MRQRLIGGGGFRSGFGGGVGIVEAHPGFAGPRRFVQPGFGAGQFAQPGFGAGQFAQPGFGAGRFGANNVILPG